MKRRFQQTGFAVWELLVGVLVIAALVFVGMTIYNSRKNTTSPVASTTSKTTEADTSNPSGGSSTSVPAAPQVTDTASLDQASAALDQVDPNSSNTNDNSQLSSQANF